MGSGIGGLLNATFGNATELIIAIVALNAGLTEVVKASLIGSIIGNILFVLGLAMYLGGLGRKSQKFNPTGASANASQFTLAAVGLAVPQFFILATHDTNTLTAEEISLGVAIILLLAYAAQMVFFLRTHAFLYNAAEEEVMHGESWSNPPRPHSSRGRHPAHRRPLRAPGGGRRVPHHHPRLERGLRRRHPRGDHRQRRRAPHRRHRRHARPHGASPGHRQRQRAADRPLRGAPCSSSSASCSASR